jgi:hypothetical protein
VLTALALAAAGSLDAPSGPAKAADTTWSVPAGHWPCPIPADHQPADPTPRKEETRSAPRPVEADAARDDTRYNDLTSSDHTAAQTIRNRTPEPNPSRRRAHVNARGPMTHGKTGRDGRRRGQGSSWGVLKS